MQHLTKFNGSNDSWEFHVYSNTLHHILSKDFNVGSGHKLIEYHDDGDSFIYCFFAEDGGSRKYEILKFNYKNGDISKYSASGDRLTSFQNYDVLGNATFVAGIQNPSSFQYLGQAIFTLTLVPIIWGTKIYNLKPHIFYSNIVSNKSLDIVPILKGESEILCTKNNNLKNTYAIIIKTLKGRKTNLNYFEYDESGKEIKSSHLTLLNEKNIISGQLIVNRDSNFTFVGTYNQNNRRRSNLANSATGIFVSSLKNGNEEYVKFHPFADFKNAKLGLNFRDRKKFENSKRNGEKIDLDFKLLLHKDIINIDSVHILLAESFFPEYHYETFNNFYGSMYSNQVFDGYRFTSAITAAFDDNGDLLWDNIFEINNIISYSLDENVIVYYDGITQVMLYYLDGKIYSKVIKGNDILYRKEATEVSTVNNDEKVLLENYGKIYHWYGQYFLLTGFQIVLNKMGEKRKVYFLLKLKFD